MVLHEWKLFVNVNTAGVSRMKYSKSIRVFFLSLLSNRLKKGELKKANENQWAKEAISKSSTTN